MRLETIGAATLYLGNSLELMENLSENVDHFICDPPYEKSLHDSKNSLQTRLRQDSGPSLKGLDFEAIDGIRDRVVTLGATLARGWFIAFCTVEGTWEWARSINASPMKYKRACAWIKPDSTPQLNGQGPAQGFECFVTAWAGDGHAHWNSGGKRGVYTHLVNNSERHGEHPTEKPRRLMAEIISDFTLPGETILDPFMGSGTTGVAAVQAGRKFIGMEMNERYFQIACDRLSAAQIQADMFIAPAQKAKQGALEWGK
jgi:site-specific DNA-methyltransferase (adenine-specific)